MCFLHSDSSVGGGGLNDNTALVICQQFTFGGEGFGEDANRRHQCTRGRMGL